MVETLIVETDDQGHPTSIFGKYLFGGQFEIWSFRNICCKISCLPASPRIFEHLKNGIIAHLKRIFLGFLLGCPASPVIKWVFGRRCQKVVIWGRENTWVWYVETMFSQMVSYDFHLHEPLHGYFLYLVCAPPEKPTRRCEPEEGYLRCSKRFNHACKINSYILFHDPYFFWSL